jgi:hypothetical protein
MQPSGLLHRFPDQFVRREFVLPLGFQSVSPEIRNGITGDTCCTTETLENIQLFHFAFCSGFIKPEKPSFWPSREGIKNP